MQLHVGAGALLIDKNMTFISSTIVDGTYEIYHQAIYVTLVVYKNNALEDWQYQYAAYDTTTFAGLKPDKFTHYYLIGTTGSYYSNIYQRQYGDIIEQTENFKVLTAAERTKISTYLTDFNGENLLLKLNGDGLVPTANIPDLSGTYLKVASPTYAGVMTGNAHYSTTNADLVLEKRGETGLLYRIIQHRLLKLHLKKVLEVTMVSLTSMELIK